MAQCYGGSFLDPIIMLFFCCYCVYDQAISKRPRQPFSRRGTMHGCKQSPHTFDVCAKKVRAAALYRWSCSSSQSLKLGKFMGQQHLATQQETSTSSGVIPCLQQGLPSIHAILGDVPQALRNTLHTVTE